MSINSLYTHRTIRRYNEKKVNKELLNKLVEAAIRGSNTGNMQLYSIIATQEQKIKEELSPAHFNQKMVSEAPLVITICVDINRMNKWCSQRNADAGFGNMGTFITASIDATIAAQNMTLAAEEEGLGVCYLGTTTYNPDVIADVLNLPKGVMPLITLTIGYPAEEPSLTERLPIEAILHNEKYNDYTDADIDRLYAEKENNVVNKRFVVENGKENLAQVFSEIRYSRQSNESTSEKFMETLKRQWF